MSLPVIADKRPSVHRLEAGKEYWWCACGRSQDQPWCDGSHAGTDFSPKSFTVSEEKNYALCHCKHTGKAPFCDNAHRDLAGD